MSQTQKTAAYFSKTLHIVLKTRKNMCFKKSFNIILMFFCASPIYLSYSFFFFFSLSCLSFFFSSFLLCIIPHVFLSFYVFMTWTVFMVVVLLLIDVFSSCSLLFFPCCSSFLFFLNVSFAFECKEQQATSNETQTLRITKKHVLKSLTFAKIQESNKFS